MSGYGSRVLRWVVGMALLAVLGLAREGIGNLFHRALPGGGSAVDAANQRLVLELEGGTVELELERLDVYLTEDDGEAESFELHGPDVMLAGQLPTGLKVDYAENWGELVDRAIPVVTTGGDQSDPKTSTITLPDIGPCRILDGSVVVETVGEGSDAKTPLRGTCTLRCATPDGDVEVRGTFTVLGTTWG